VAAWTASTLLLAVLLAATIQRHPLPTPTAQLEKKVGNLESELRDIKNEAEMPAVVLSRHRQSICFIYGVYSFTGSEAGRRAEPTNFSGTGFVVADGLIATNRHVAEPWFEDDEAAMLMRHGAKPHLEKLLAFFPNHREGIELTGITVSPDADIAVAHYSTARAPDLAPLPLADAPGEPGAPVILVGYPMGIAAMVAKSPRPVYRRLAYRRADIGLARELAELSLIRPSATQGHLGDVLGDKLIYDAVTAHGGSGGPVFNNRGQVIGVNTAYLDGFSGGTLGIFVRALRPVISEARRKR
jgi:S1-C subfamily serine protease